MLVAVAAAWAGAYDALKLRDGADCAALGGGAEVRDELIALAEGDVQPAYVPMRAAACLVERFAGDPAVVERARAWVTEEQWAGLGMVVAARIDSFAVEDAVGIAQAAVVAEDRRVLRRIAKSERKVVRSVVEGLAGAEGGR